MNAQLGIASALFKAPAESAAGRGTTWKSQEDSIHPKPGLPSIIKKFSTHGPYSPQYKISPHAEGLGRNLRTRGRLYFSSFPEPSKRWPKTTLILTILYSFPLYFRLPIVFWAHSMRPRNLGTCCCLVPGDADIQGDRITIILPAPMDSS
ncbi:hypothetical protein BD779DRAFT_1010721 [Infundibulicybe gibba]|nr:hypothetical protein BD779DRAFT_1010721 [Infundibulicybe gibba]